MRFWLIVRPFPRRSQAGYGGQDPSAVRCVSRLFAEPNGRKSGAAQKASTQFAVCLNIPQRIVWVPSGRGDTDQKAVCQGLLNKSDTSEPRFLSATERIERETSRFLWATADRPDPGIDQRRGMCAFVENAILINLKRKVSVRARVAFPVERQSCALSAFQQTCPCGPQILPKRNR